MTQKKAEISQAFTYIMVVIVFSVVFLFGYKAINHFVGEGEKVAFITFKNELEDAVKSIGFGSVTVFNAEHPLRVPGRYASVCFLDYDITPKPDWVTDQSKDCPDDLPVEACDAFRTYDQWESADANVFLNPPGQVPIKVYRIKLKKDNLAVPYRCFPVAGRLDMRVVGQGTHTLIT